MNSRLHALTLALLCAVLGACAGNHQPSTFTGAWKTKESGSSDFSLYLVQSGNQIQGYHTAVALHGDRIDAVLPEYGQPSIAGNINGNTATIEFRSGYSNATGAATIRLQENTILWTITSSTPGHYLPNPATLYRQKSHQIN